MPPSISRTTTAQIGTLYSAGVPTPQVFTTNKVEKVFWFGKEGNRGYPHLLGQRDIGHGMHLSAHEDVYDLVDIGDAVWFGSNPNDVHYKGKLQVAVTAGGYWNQTFLPDSWGATAYSKMKPTNPQFSYFNSVYELKDLPGMLRQRLHSNGLKNIGSYYLALKFGWEQLFKDIRRMCSLQQKVQKKLSWLIQHEGQPVKTKTNMVDTRTEQGQSSGSSYGAFQPVLPTQFYHSVPTYRNIEWSTDKVWAEGSFRFWLPEGPRDINWTKSMLSALDGSSFPSPSQIYNAIPWTWLIDWFSNVGDIINNIDAGVAKGLASDHWYIMREVAYYRQFTANGEFNQRDGSIKKVTGTSWATATEKYRSKGDPFGFATSASNLSTSQLAILGALGLSKLR
uniref:Uncharacterized protein n=2 Tax=Leviviricetes TaxID=2842243 RepID=A0A514D1P0_9VIRU|nr:MAG: hypothetical protein H3BulkLitter17941_000001 [Leviviridae sp.]